MVQLLLDCNYIAFAYMAIEIRLLPKDRQVPSLITEQTHPKGKGNRKQRNQEFKSNGFIRNNFKK